VELNESVGAVKRMEITERVTLIFRAEFFNVFNRVVYGAPASNVSLASFGVVSSQSTRRGKARWRCGWSSDAWRELSSLQSRESSRLFLVWPGPAPWVRYARSGAIRRKERKAETTLGSAA